MKAHEPSAREKAAATKRATLTPKEAAFSAEYAKTGNGTQSALKVYDTDGYMTAASMANENLKKPKVKEEIARLMSANGVELSHVLTIHKRNMNQSKHLPTSQTAVRDFYDILGMRNSEKPQNDIKIAFVIEK